jgi:hypothetical protein
LLDSTAWPANKDAKNPQNRQTVPVPEIGRVKTIGTHDGEHSAQTTNGEAFDDPNHTTANIRTASSHLKASE